MQHQNDRYTNRRYAAVDADFDSAILRQSFLGDIQMAEYIRPRYDFFFSSRRRHTRLQGDWSSDVCSSDLGVVFALASLVLHGATCAFWKRRTGYWLPFIWYHAATYPVESGDLARVLRIYPEIGRASCRERV